MSSMFFARASARAAPNLRVASARNPSANCFFRVSRSIASPPRAKVLRSGSDAIMRQAVSTSGRRVSRRASICQPGEARARTKPGWQSGALLEVVPMAKRLEGRVVIVTGGGHGIGKAYCRAVAQEGARVVVAEIDAKAAETTATALRAEGADALDVATDVADEKSTRAMADAALERFGQIDVLINNAA